LLDRPERTPDDARRRIRKELMNSSRLTGIAAVLFGCGVIALLAAIFRNADAHGGVLIWVGLGLLAATVVCWFAAARAQRG
jgi:hypothetical protein